MARIVETSGHGTYAEAIAKADDGKEFVGQSANRGLADHINNFPGEGARLRAERNALAKARRYERK